MLTWISEVVVHIGDWVPRLVLLGLAESLVLDVNRQHESHEETPHDSVLESLRHGAVSHAKEDEGEYPEEEPEEGS